MKRVLLLAALAACASSRAKDGGGLVPFAPQGVTDGLARPRRFAVVVGSDAFDDARFTPLRYAEADARAMAAALSSFDDVRLLVGADTTRASILAAIAEVQAKARGPRDTVLVYVSTHGSLGRAAGEHLGRYLIARDTRLDLVADTGISVDRLVESMAAMPSRRQVLILAACHSGRGKSLLPRDVADKLAREKAAPALEEVSEAAIVLAAAAFGETAREDDRLGHDVYTHYLLEALERGDRDGDGAVTVSEAHDYARERTYAFTGGQQRPFAESRILGVDPIVLRGAPSRAARPVLFSYSRSADGLGVVVNGQLKGTLPGGVALDPGQHELALTRAAGGPALYHGTIALRPGEVVDLYDYLPGPPRLELSLESGVFAPLSGGGYFPTALQVGVRAGARNWPLQDFDVDAGVHLLRGAGTTEGFAGELLDFDLHGVRADLRLLRPLATWRRVSIETGIAAGGLWATQAIRADGYRGGQSLFGGTVSAVAATSWRIAGRVELGAELEVGALWAALGGPVRGHPIFAGTGFARLLY